MAYENGIVKDTSTGLEWIAGQDKDTPLGRRQIVGGETQYWEGLANAQNE